VGLFSHVPAREMDVIVVVSGHGDEGDSAGTVRLEVTVKSVARLLAWARGRSYRQWA
jgi:hypothetical protein